jgi:H+/Cl- antiporter ClcA
VLFQWIVYGAVVGVVCGVSSAIFLFALDKATAWREGNPGWIFALPLAGGGIGLLYDRWGRAIRAGNNLVLDTLHEDGPRIPLRMTPMVLLGTVVTHLFGGSAGREGTAVQMGASLADAFVHGFKINREVRRDLLVAGIAGGFGSVFGTPIAGALFGLEVLCIGRLEYAALVPALVASLVGDWVTRALGSVHTPYPSVDALSWSFATAGKWLILALAVALVARAFIALTHAIKHVGEKYLPWVPVRPVVGGVLVVLLWRALGTSEHLGLSLPTLLRAFHDPALPPLTFAWKLLFTAITLGTGFLGGEVTPLFVMGATLGNTVGQTLGLPLAMAAAVGMAALFGAAANTPLALTVMAAELVGVNALSHAAFVCVAAFVLSGHRGIYPSQRIVRSKWTGRTMQPQRLKDVS